MLSRSGPGDALRLADGLREEAVADLVVDDFAAADDVETANLTKRLAEPGVDLNRAVVGELRFKVDLGKFGHFVSFVGVTPSRQSEYKAPCLKRQGLKNIFVHFFYVSKRKVCFH